MSASTVHYMGTEFAQRTACGRYLPPTSALAWTPEPSEVTCRSCLKQVRYGSAGGAR